METNKATDQGVDPLISIGIFPIRFIILYRILRWLRKRGTLAVANYPDIQDQLRVMEILRSRLPEPKTQVERLVVNILRRWVNTRIKSYEILLDLKMGIGYFGEK